VKDKKENHSKNRMSESVANLSILCSSGFLQQINPGNGSSFNTSLVSPKKKPIVNIASSVFGLPSNGHVEDEIVTDIRDVTLGLTHGQSDSE
jgi:hypothetical protein